VLLLLGSSSLRGKVSAGLRSDMASASKFGCMIGPAGAGTLWAWFRGYGLACVWAALMILGEGVGCNAAAGKRQGHEYVSY
jgi:hypothetical protein